MVLLVTMVEVVGATTGVLVVDALVTGVLMLDEAGGAVVLDAGAAVVVDGARVEETDSPSSSLPTHTINPTITATTPAPAAASHQTR